MDLDSDFDRDSIGRKESHHDKSMKKKPKTQGTRIVEGFAGFHSDSDRDSIDLNLGR